MAEVRESGESYTGRTPQSIVRRVYGRRCELHSPERRENGWIRATVVKRVSIPGDPSAQYAPVAVVTYRH